MILESIVTVFQKIALRGLAALILFIFPMSEGLSFEGRHYFGGDSISLPLMKLSQPCTKIRAQLYATTHAMEAPIGDPIPAKCSKPIQTVLPEVRTKTQLNLEIESLTDRGWVTTAEIALQVYPKQMLSPVREWAQNNDLVVADSDGKLELFLQNQNIPFVVNQRKNLKPPMVLVSTGQGEILFKEKAEGVPKIYIREKTVQIEMPFLDQLAVDPSYQHELLKLFENIL